MQVFRRFKSDQRGSTAMLFGLTALPLIGLAGAAIDYSRAALEQTKLQRATDAMAIALVRAPSTATPRDLQDHADRLLPSLYTVPDFVKLGTPTVTREGGRVTVQLAGTIKTALMPIAGVETVALRAGGQAVLTNAELALVLDNTGSMDESITGGKKIDALKSAARRLLDDLRAVAGTPETVKVSVVPFDTEVRLDANTYRYKPWFRWSPSADREKWTGYLYERHGDYALSDAAPDESKRDSKFPAPLETECKTNPILMTVCKAGGTLAAIQPLTSLYDGLGFKRLKDTVDAMTPRGATNVALGTMWGLATLSRSEPFSEGALPTDPSVRKYMVVLTDGKNNYHHVNGELRNDQTQVDKNTTSACTLAKTSGIEVFTIRLDEGNEQVLSGCASSKGNYFDVKSKAQLDEAFKRIVESITGARLTH